jgi:hypothetical protein
VTRARQRAIIESHPRPALEALVAKNHKKNKNGSHSKRGALDDTAQSVSDAVQQAASVLEAQLSDNLGDVKRITGGLAKNHEIDQDALDDLVTRLRSTAHEFVDVASKQVRAGTGGTDGSGSAAGGGDLQRLTTRFTEDAHGAVDAVLDLAALAPSLLTRLTESMSGSSTSTTDQPPSTPPPADPAASTASRPAARKAAPRKAAPRKAAPRKASASKSTASKTSASSSAARKRPAGGRGA